MVEGTGASSDGRVEDQMKKTTIKVSSDESMTEKDLSDLTIKKLTVKTGVKAGRMMVGGDCCPKTCHTR
jgi:hypothetical protein